jgi:hypothetical protein
MARENAFSKKSVRAIAGLSAAVADRSAILIITRYPVFHFAARCLVMTRYTRPFHAQEVLWRCLYHVLLCRTSDGAVTETPYSMKKLITPPNNKRQQPPTHVSAIAACNALAALALFTSACGSESFQAMTTGQDVSIDTSQDVSSIDAPAEATTPDVESDAPLDSTLDVLSDSAAVADACTPKTCKDLGLACGNAPDECGGIAECAACSASTACVSGKCCIPEHGGVAWDATPSNTCGSVCGLANLNATDDKTAGLACDGAGAAEIDGQSVTACIGVDFGAPLPIGPVNVRASAVKTICTVSCTGTDCGTGTAMRIFAGNTKTTLKFLKTFGVPAIITDFAVTLTSPARYVVVCRSGYGNTHDQLAIDSVRAALLCP